MEEKSLLDVHLATIEQPARSSQALGHHLHPQQPSFLPFPGVMVRYS
jgi:hypothetical protein